MRISVILPTYNEFEGVTDIVPRIEAVVKQTELDLEIIVVDDGSKDGTLEAIQDLSSKYGNIVAIGRPCKMGFGSAIKKGIEVSTGDLICTMEADGSQYPEYLPKMLCKMFDGCGLVLGSRFAPGSSIANVPLKKYIMSRIYNLFFCYIYGTGVHDNTTGFQLYTKEFAKRAHVMNIENNDFSFLLEIVLKAKRMKMRIAETPTTYVYRKRGSKFGMKAFLSYVGLLLNVITHKSD